MTGEGEPYKKPNAKHPLGSVIRTVVPDDQSLRKLTPSEAILVSSIMLLGFWSYNV